MTIVRKDPGFLVLFADGRPSQCLEGLALKCGFRVGEMSDALEHSERYVHEVFARDLGMPPKRWLRHQRMAVALRLLRAGLRPGEVADRLGFAQGNGFRREFRQFCGVLPGEYARRVVLEESCIGFGSEWHSR
jgi:AraC-like DNA-binding protein